MANTPMTSEMEFFVNQFCKRSPENLKAYMNAKLGCKTWKDSDFRYHPVVKEGISGYLYAKGTVPVLLVAHLDTVHRSLPNKIKCDNGKLSCAEGIGGDDRCGVYMIDKITDEFPCSVLLCDDEEVGAVGASTFCKSELIKDLGVHYMIELDRNGKNDAVFYECDNQEFTDFIIKNTGYKKQPGTWTDICKLMPASGIAGVNFSCGYYLAHTNTEYVMFGQMEDTIETVKELLKVETDKAFEFIERKYTYYSGSQRSLYDGFHYSKEEKEDEEETRYQSLYEKHFADMMSNKLSLTVLFGDNYSGEEVSDVVEGESKLECWGKFFVRNPECCAYDVIDYSFE